MVTKTAVIVKAVQLMTNRGHTVFNDRLVDGRRSVKVWGWNQDDYQKAASMLREAGCKAEVKQVQRVKRVSWTRKRYQVTRLIVAE